jgi:hypothetical protein
MAVAEVTTGDEGTKGDEANGDAEVTIGGEVTAGAEVTTAVPRAARRGPISRAARVNTLRVAVSYPSRYASSRSRTVRYH